MITVFIVGVLILYSAYVIRRKIKKWQQGNYCDCNSCNCGSCEKQKPFTKNS